MGEETTVMMRISHVLGSMVESIVICHDGYYKCIRFNDGGKSGAGSR